MKDEHIYSPSFKKEVLEKIDSLKAQIKLPTKKATVVKTVEPQTKPAPIKVAEVPVKETLVVNQTVRSSLKTYPNQPNKPQAKRRQTSAEKIHPKSRKFKMTRETEEKILVFTLLFSVVSIIILGILISYFNFF